MYLFLKYYTNVCLLALPVCYKACIMYSCIYWFFKKVLAKVIYYVDPFFLKVHKPLLTHHSTMKRVSSISYNICCIFVIQDFIISICDTIFVRNICDKYL